MGAPTIQSGVNNVLCLFSLSIFGRVEAPNLKPMVTLQAWLVHDPGKPPRYVLLLCTPIYSQAYQQSARERIQSHRDECAEKRLVQEMNGAFLYLYPSQHSSAGKESAQQEAQAQFPGWEVPPEKE